MTNPNIKRMGLGLAALGRPGYMNIGHSEDMGRQYAIDQMQSRCFQVLDYAYKAQIRYFDVARSYGRAEEFLANWLKTKESDDIMVGSKWGYTYTANWQAVATSHEVKDHSLAALERQLKESQATLGNHLHLYQIHSVVPETKVLENSKVLNFLARLKEQKVQIGLSVSGPSQGATIDQAIAINIDNQRLFDSVQATYNLFETAAAPALARAHEQGLSVIVKEGLANGRLTTRNQNLEDVTAMATLQQVSQKLATSIDSLALAAILKQPWANRVLSGAATVDQLASNLQALTIDINHEIALELAKLQQDSVSYWQQRSTMAWQ